MFQNACKLLIEAMLPIVVTWRLHRGAVECGIGAGVVINEEGYFITAGHILREIDKLNQEVAKIKSASRVKPNQITNCAAVFGKTNARSVSATVQQELDLGIGKLNGVAPPQGFVFPKFRVHEVEQGELLCRLGYPFVDGIRPTWDREKGFTFTNVFPVPLFVNEALVSRFGKLPSGVWIETSSPGLKGQSGGPLIDSDGYICGIQVNTRHYPLGFKGTGRNQVLNVGRAVHVESIRKFLDENKVKYYVEGE